MALDLSASGADEAFSLVSKGNSVCIQAVWTGSPVGTLQLRASVNGVNFATISGTSVDINGADTYIWTERDALYNFIQVYYTRTSGSGTLTTYPTIKQGGANL